MSNKLKPQVGDFVIFEVIHGGMAKSVMLYVGRLENRDGVTCWNVATMTSGSVINISETRIREVLDGRAQANKIHEYLFARNSKLLEDFESAGSQYLREASQIIQDYKAKYEAI